jgi:hypothetical protein
MLMLFTGSAVTIAGDDGSSVKTPAVNSEHSASSHLHWRLAPACGAGVSPATDSGDECNTNAADSCRPAEWKAVHHDSHVILAQRLVAADPSVNPFSDEPETKPKKSDAKADDKAAPTFSAPAKLLDPFAPESSKTNNRVTPVPSPASPSGDLDVRKTPSAAPPPLTPPPATPPLSPPEENQTTTKAACDQEREALRANTIDKVRLDIRPLISGSDVLPGECMLEEGRFSVRSWDSITYTWKASALCHKPLYFEEVALERYGHSRGPILDPLVSAAHFFITVPLLPYEMGVEPPHECEYTLGYYRPGSCAPWIIDGFPISLRGMALEFTTVTGAAFAIP